MPERAVQAPATGGPLQPPIVAHHVISHRHRARATVVKVDEAQFTLDGHADFRHPQKVPWGLLWRGSIFWKKHFGALQVPERAFWAPERHGGL